MVTSESNALAGEDLQKALEAFVGSSEGAPGTSPYPINEAMIHHWCDAMGDRNPSYLEPEFASRSVHGGIVAPPQMLQAWTMRGLRPATAEEASAAAAVVGQKTVLQLLDEAGFTSVVATNCEQEYFRYLKPGDQLTHTIEVESVSPEKKTGLGVGHFLTQLYTFRDSEGEIVGTMRFRILKFRPPSETAKKQAQPVIGPRLPGGRPRPSLNQDVAFFWEGVA
ncbi:MAG: MaoC family dehydratase N-terminal domain-containing protein, partial [Myxococcota bacterium]